MSQSVIKFLNNYLLPQANGEYSAEDLYIRYVKFCKQSNFVPHARTQFSQLLRQTIHRFLPNVIITRAYGTFFYLFRRTPHQQIKI